MGEQVLALQGDAVTFPLGGALATGRVTSVRNHEYVDIALDGARYRDPEIRLFASQVTVDLVKVGDRDGWRYGQTGAEPNPIAAQRIARARGRDYMVGYKAGRERANESRKSHNLPLF